MKTAICAIAKCENRYIKEWVDYHLALGFTHIYIWDNNSIDGECISDVLIGYDSSVTILDCRGKLSYQTKVYTMFYNEYRNLYDWIAFIDIDEFITFAPQSGLRTIEEFLRNFSDEIQVVRLNWMCYGDNDLTELGDFKVLSRFVKPLPYDKHIQYDFPENNHIKSIMRGGLDIGTIQINPHCPDSDSLVAADADGKKCMNELFQPYSYKTAFVRHYVTKTIAEWLAKVARGIATSASMTELYHRNTFFQYNEHTPEKDNIIYMYEFFSETLKESIGTRLMISEHEKQKLQDQFANLSHSYDVVVNSYAYKIGRVLLAPIHFITNKFRGCIKTKS